MTLKQPVTRQHIAIFRIALSLVCIVWVFGVDVLFYSEFSRFSNSVFGIPNYWSLMSLKYGAILIGLLFCIGFYTKVTGWIFTLLFCLLSYFVISLGTTLWNYNSHLLFFLIILCLNKSRQVANEESADLNSLTIF